MDVVTLVRDYWDAVGVKTSIKAEDRVLMEERGRGSFHQIAAFEVGTPGLFSRHDTWIPVTGGNQTYEAPLYGLWYATNGEKGEEPTGDFVKLLDLWEEIEVTIDLEKRNELAHQIYQIHANNTWMIGTVGGIPKLVIPKNYVRNVPEIEFSSYNVGGYLGLAQVSQFFIRQE